MTHPDRAARQATGQADTCRTVDVDCTNCGHLWEHHGDEVCGVRSRHQGVAYSCGCTEAQEDPAAPVVGQPAAAPDTDARITVVSLARMLSAADVEINHGNYPTYDTLAESGQQQYRQAARYLLARLHITTRQTVEDETR
ncbi:hypothetical protein ACFUIZ_18900 [Streptomyces cinereoruber]|uniref:hypothetical protein n=1 Tax=Streptomyces cinereoruber TaxID=67260 RepID=UPI00364179EA